MRKNPYAVLGIGRRADQKDIKSAYRRAAKKSHPDLTAEDAEDHRFREIQEAYEILKDDERRRKCDEDLDRDAAGDRRRKQDASPAFQSTRLHPRGRRPPVEPLAADDGAGHDVRRVGGRARFALEIVLSPAEARSGGRFPVQIPVESECPECHSALPWLLACPACGGLGAVSLPMRFTLVLPGGIRDGSRTSISLTDPSGARNVIVDLLFRIDVGAA